MGVSLIYLLFYLFLINLNTKTQNLSLFLVHTYWILVVCVYKACLAASGLTTYVCAMGNTQRNLVNPVGW